jgi:hypothetical protein
MFRIGGEEDLLDRPTAPPACSSPSPATMPETSTPRAPAPTQPLRRREPRAHQDRGAGRRDRSTAPPTRRQRPGLTGLHSWIAWVNAAILIVLIVAAVIGHDPPSTTAVGRAPSTTTRQPAAAQTVASSVGARPATTMILPKPLAHRRHSLPSHRPRPRVTVQAHLASEAPTDRPPPAPTPQGGSASPPAAIAQPVASPSAPAPRSVTPTPSQHRRAAKNSQNAAAVEFGP